ncbi:hypothetical protein FACS189496_4430 [Bacilli bacterium]|nr:hypothetical protein FACS189496_4430 [Bacilli bacterium]
MSAAKFETIRVRFNNANSKNNKFYTYNRKILFDGFRKVYTPYSEEDKVVEIGLNKIKVGLKLNAKEIEVKEHISSPPPRYNQSSLVKTLDESGVGRPSTYNSMAQKPLTENYAILENKAYHMTEKGDLVIQNLFKYFPDIIDKDFTRDMEDHLDDIQAGDEE